MKLFKINLNSSRIRVLYDVALAAAASGFVFLFGLATGGEQLWQWMLAAPLLFLGFNLVLGVYHKFRVGNAWLKFGLMSTSVVLTTLAGGLIFGFSAQILAWFGFIWMPSFLPRVMLNLNYNTQYRSTLFPALKERGPVLVVGGAGYIGSHVVDILLKKNQRVRVLDSLLYGREGLEDFFKDSRFELVEGDATDIVKLVQAMDGVSAVVHLAGLVGDPACAVDEAFTRHTNVITTRMVKEVAKSVGVPRFIFASSCSVYGMSDEEVDENSALNPVSLYAKTKIDSENELLHQPNENFCVTILRFATVFGDSRRPRFDLVGNLFTAQGMTEGTLKVQGAEQWRPFVHVRDLARAIVLVLGSPKAKIDGEIFNVGDKRLNLTIGMLAEAVQKIVREFRPCELTTVPFSDRRNYAVSFEKIKSTLGFQSETLVDDGIREIAQKFKKNAYGHFQEPKYSNVAMTKRAVEAFGDPMQTTKLYRPVTDFTVSAGEGPKTTQAAR